MNGFRGTNESSSACVLRSLWTFPTDARCQNSSAAFAYTRLSSLLAVFGSAALHVGRRWENREFSTSNFITLARNGKLLYLGNLFIGLF